MLDFIGDWILTTPFFENLRHNGPQAEITAVVLDRVFDLAHVSSMVDRAISVSRADHRRLVFSAGNVSVLAGFQRDYQVGRFDLAFVPRWDADFNGALQIAIGSRARHVVGFSERSMTRRGALNRGDDRFYTHAVVDRRMVHEADRDLVLIEAVGGTPVAAKTRIEFTSADVILAESFLSATLCGTGRFMAVAPFGSKRKTTLPPERLARIAGRLAEEFDLGVVVVGGPRDARAATAFARDAGPRAIPAAGRLSTRASAALIARATVFVGMDSGPAHIAAAVGTPVAVLSCHPVGGAPGHANAPERFAPRGNSDVLVIRPTRPTVPCVDGCEADGPHCILALDEAVLWPRLASFVGAAALISHGYGPKTGRRTRTGPETALAR